MRLFKKKKKKLRWVCVHDRSDTWHLTASPVFYYLGEKPFSSGCSRASFASNWTKLFFSASLMLIPNGIIGQPHWNGFIHLNKSAIFKLRKLMIWNGQKTRRDLETAFTSKMKIRKASNKKHHILATLQIEKSIFFINTTDYLIGFELFFSKNICCFRCLPLLFSISFWMQ